MSNPIIAGAAAFAAQAFDAQKATLEADAANGVKLLVEDGSKLAESAASKLPALAADTINGLISEFSGTAEAGLDKAADLGIEAFSAWLHGLAGQAPAAPAPAPAPAAEAAPNEVAPAAE